MQSQLAINRPCGFDLVCALVYNWIVLAWCSWFLPPTCNSLINARNESFCWRTRKKRVQIKIVDHKAVLELGKLIKLYHRKTINLASGTATMFYDEPKRKTSESAEIKKTFKIKDFARGLFEFRHWKLRPNFNFSLCTDRAPHCDH